MDWKNPIERTQILQSATRQYEKDIIELAENLAKHITAGGTVIDYDGGTKVYNPDQLANALLLLYNNFTGGGRPFYDSQPWVVRQLIVFQAAYTQEMQRRRAAHESSGK
jgi:hypothetical protein